MNQQFLPIPEFDLGIMIDCAIEAMRLYEKKVVRKFPTWQAYWDWWIGDTSLPGEDECQLSLEWSSGMEDADD